MLDAGMVGTEMLYWLVGSRELRRRADVHRLAQPEGVHGREAGARGRARAVGRRGHPGHPPADRGRASRAAAAGGSLERSSSTRRSSEAALRFVDPSAIKPLKVVVDGGNGMAGPMVGPLLERLGARPRDRPTGRRTANFPDHEPNPLLRRTARSSSTRSSPRARTWASPGTATPTAASSSTTRARSSTATSSRRCSPRRCWRRSPARRSSTTCAPAAPCPTPSRPPAARRWSTASATPSSRRACATTGAIFGGEVSGHYYFREFYNADSGTLPRC